MNSLQSRIIVRVVASQIGPLDTQRGTPHNKGVNVHKTRRLAIAPIFVAALALPAILMTTMPAVSAAGTTGTSGTRVSLADDAQNQTSDGWKFAKYGRDNCLSCM